MKKIKLIFIVIIGAILLSNSTWAMAGTPASGYAIYTNNELGFSFKYPKQWHLKETPKGIRGSLLLELSGKGTSIDCYFYEDHSKQIKTMGDKLDSIKLHARKKIIVNNIHKINVKGGEVFIGEGISTGWGVKGKKYEVGFLYLSSHSKKSILKSSIPDEQFKNIDYLFVDPTSEELVFAPNVTMDNIDESDIPEILKHDLLRAHFNIIVEFFPLGLSDRNEYIKMLKSIVVY